jgi:hypothetical protein
VVVATLVSGLLHGFISPLVSIVLASAAAAFAMAYSAAILISVLRLALRHDGPPHRGAEIALRLLLGADSTQQQPERADPYGGYDLPANGGYGLPRHDEG